MSIFERRYRLPALMLLLATLLAACSSQSPIIQTDPSNAQPTPTVSAAFIPQVIPTATRVVVPTLPPRPARPNNASVEPQIVAIPVYDEKLHAGWSLEHSFHMNYDLAQTSFVDQGRYAIHAQPSVTTGMLYFTRTPEATQVYRRDQVLGLRFRLSGGALPVTNDALLVTVVGSNARPYWVANDTSVSLDGRVIDEPDQNQPLFSETRLYFLDINHTIPAREWIEVEVLLDDLIYDPSYTYVTGFYFKTDKELLPSFYVDQVSLLLLANAGAGQ